MGKDLKNKMIKIGTSLRSSQVEKLEKYFPVAQQLQSKAIQGAVEMFIEAIDNYGEKFVLSQLLGEKGKYKIVPTELDRTQ
jgi:hypothetical protein